MVEIGIEIGGGVGDLSFDKAGGPRGNKGTMEDEDEGGVKVGVCIKKRDLRMSSERRGNGLFALKKPAFCFLE